MDLTTELKHDIDLKDYRALLMGWCYAPAGDPMFQGESCEYWGRRMKELRDANPGMAVAASKVLDGMAEEARYDCTCG